jgi:hypothetical protein
MDLPVSVINGRFKVLDRPEPAPGHCAVCGSVSKPVIDFDMTVDYYGAVLLCTDCIREAFIIMGSLHPELMEPAQVVPLFDPGKHYDMDMVHEYLAASLESTRRLIAILPDSDFSDENAEDLLGTVGADSEPLFRTDDNGAQLNLFQGPDDVPTITGRKARSIFDE